MRCVGMRLPRHANGVASVKKTNANIIKTNAWMKPTKPSSA